MTISSTDPSQPVSNRAPDKFIDYEQRPDGIHVFHFFSVRPEGVTEWARHMDDIIEATGDSGMILQMLDVAHGVAPMANMLGEIRSLVARHNYHPSSRVAVLDTSTISSAILKALLPLLPVRDVKIRYFGLTEQDNAVAWLLAHISR